MNPEDIGGILDMLVERLGPMGTEVWGIYVRQQLSWGVVAGALRLAFATLLFVVARKAGKWVKREMTSDTNGTAVAWGGLIILGLIASVAMLTVMSPILHILNPEFYAIQALLGR
ncbi:hypothetical protein LCGC14_0313100 [marine sediment metagenome]|uniref:Uncharacterized protein n=1 Tax=marine sediment metagenome TaxID=412755 RepID=A0A0F9WT86_9ZZZZ